MKWTWEEIWEDGMRWYDVKEQEGSFVTSCDSMKESQLIAAAPELLEHLQRVTDQLAVVGDMSHYKDGRIVEEAREVMRKARGEND